MKCLLGIDVGSTTTKAVVLDEATLDVLYSTYRRHHAHQAESLKPIFEDIAAALPDATFRMAMSGSGGTILAECLGVPYMQEVVANAAALALLHPSASCAIELGGQDAKMIFFDHDAAGNLTVSDMRMNGSCAGGTGAFIDEIASLLQVPVEDVNAMAQAGETVYSISGRCGVYAKTDIQPLLNQGARKEDIALSTFHAIAKQTLGGLSQGLDVNPPVVFEGGPLTFNPRLVSVFAERLALSDDDIIIPESPETIVAHGAALSLTGMFAHVPARVDLTDLIVRLDDAAVRLREQSSASAPFFATPEECEAFQARHALRDERGSAASLQPGSTVHAYLGIDSGSTTTKFALVSEDGELIDSFYANNEGEPLDIAKDALMDIARTYRDAGIRLDILGCGTTGYGELLFAKAFHADTHVVETVAHSFATAQSVPNATFILDIGGQDMKAIWLADGIVTDILVNEACSSGCGSFLENFAKSLNIPTQRIAEAAFRSESPAVLGSRCTVFMNSSVVTEQRNGKSPDDIMAGLCRSIIENVFTKVIRVSNLDSLGDTIVVQGGTFKNDAVLAAFEQHVGHPVMRAPYPGLMGAIGAALLTQRFVEERVKRDGSYASTFIGLDKIDEFTYSQTANVTCPFCMNACSRTLITFGDGSTFVTGNRCERGEIVGDTHDAAVREQVKAVNAARNAVPNLFELRQKLLFQDYDVDMLCEPRNYTIGLPRVLALWDTAPFWTTFYRALGFSVRLSPLSSRAQYEHGLSAVCSDTICFPAKLVHGHIRDLCGDSADGNATAKAVDRIFMPVITTVPSENTVKTSESMCAVVKGYPMVIRNSDNPTKRYGIPFDDPLWHWYSTADRERQLSAYMLETYGIAPSLTKQAIAQGDRAQTLFATTLRNAGKQVIDQVVRNDGYAVVLASRPYHNDPLVNHDLPAMFTSLGIPVLTPDAIPGATEVDLSKSRLDIVNNFHARMLSSAIIAAQSDHLEYAQVVSFGCGHDAYLSDEIVRLMRESGGKSPLILKVDESDIAGPLRIRVRSFVESVTMRRETGMTHDVHDLIDAYPVKFTKDDVPEKVVLIPNTSHAFARLMAAVFSRQGLRAIPMDIGREEAIRLGKKYVHNDICFPAQIVIGEALAALESGDYDGMDVAIGTGKYIGDCRLTHYAALLRKALDDAGYAHIPIITNDDVDFHDIHPGFKMNTLSAARAAMALPMIDALEELVRKMRPYELVPGSANEAFERALDCVIEGIEKDGNRGAKRGFKEAIRIMNGVAYDRSKPRPRVLIVGEYLLNFHPGANHDIEDYLERNGFEIIEARMTDVLRKTYFYKNAQIREYKVTKPLPEATWYTVANALFEHAHDVTDRIAAAHPLYEPACRMPELVQASDPIIHHTFDAGEGVLIPGEILHHAARGCRSFLILQPFGCLPNHIVGRGIAKKLKEYYPDASILPLDYDPDVSFANIENRLQMLVMTVRASEAAEPTYAAEYDPANRPSWVVDALSELANYSDSVKLFVGDVRSNVSQLRERAQLELSAFTEQANIHLEEGTLLVAAFAESARQYAETAREEINAYIERARTGTGAASVITDEAYLDIMARIDVLAQEMDAMAAELDRIVANREHIIAGTRNGTLTLTEQERADAAADAEALLRHLEELRQLAEELRMEAEELRRAA